MRNYKSLLIAIFFISACGGGGSDGGGGGGSAVNQQDIDFTSVTPDSFTDLRDNVATLSDVTVTGTLYLPQNTTTPVPVVVITHGARGVSHKHINWAERMNNIGVGAFVIESFIPRGATDQASRSALSGAVRVADALFAIQALASVSEVDSSRLGIIASGGASGYATAIDELSNAVNPGGTRFVVHVGFYQNCGTRVASNNISSAPIRLFHGELDDWNSADSCMQFVNQMAAIAGVDVAITVYPGAMHNFDSSIIEGAVPSATSSVNCFAERTLDTNVRRNFDTGMVFANSTDYQNYLSSCRTTGANAGADSTALNDAISQVETLLTTAFSL